MISISFALLKNGEIYNMRDNEYIFKDLKFYKLEAKKYIVPRCNELAQKY